MYGTLGLLAWTLEVVGVLTGYFGLGILLTPGNANPYLPLSFLVASAACFGVAVEFMRRERSEMQFQRTKNWAYYLFLMQGIISASLALNILFRLGEFSRQG
ncbi:MAG: hypothetical protein NTV70_00185 [Acidobacteria bacterium]|nr:hypothetical protein [Acidobacteriota bacterium]